MFLLLEKAIRDSIFNNLPIKAKFQLAISNKQLHSSYYNRLVNTVLTVNVQRQIESDYLFKNISYVEIVSKEVDIQYLAKFLNLQILDVSSVNFADNLDPTKAIFKNLKALKAIHVSDNQLEMFRVTLNFFKIEVELVVRKRGIKREHKDSNSDDIKTKKSRLLSSVQKKIAELELYQSRIKYALCSPSSFLPRSPFLKFKELDMTTYTATIDWEPCIIDTNTKDESIEYTIMQLKELLIHAIVINQDNSWILISQIEVYYKDKGIDAIAFTTKHDIYPKDLVIKMERQTNEGGGSWYELRLNYDKFEVIVTGGFSSKEGDPSKFIPFLGVGVPGSLATNNHLILFSPSEAAETITCARMLRDYMRAQSLNNWCFKSDYFVKHSFHTPLALNLFLDTDGYVYVASKLINLIVTKTISKGEVDDLNTRLDMLEYWKHLGFEEAPSLDFILQKITETRTSRQRKRLSEAKCTLVEAVLTYEDGKVFTKTGLTTIFNGLLYPRVKAINKQRVNMMKNQLNK